VEQLYHRPLQVYERKEECGTILTIFGWVTMDQTVKYDLSRQPSVEEG
jgi:hypothetical protein